MPFRLPCLAFFASDAMALSKVLIVDDNVWVYEAFRSCWEDERMAVSQARNGLEALGLLAQARFDFVLMDIRMPVMDGIDAVRTIRSFATLEELPVFAFTGVPHEIRSEHAPLFNATLCKPITPHDALREIVKNLTRARD